MTENSPTLSGSQLTTLAEAFRLLGDPSRLRIMMYCISETKAVGDIAETLNLSQTLVSHHLRLLRSARLLSSERKSKFVFYRIADSHVKDMLVEMAAHYCEDHP